jgi:elongation factor P
MLAEAIREGQVLLMNGAYQQVVACELHKGSATTGMMVHVKLRNLQTGAMTEQRYAPDAKVEEAPIDIKPMQYLYAESDSLVFMDPQSYEQLSIAKKAIGPAVAYLSENMEVPVMFDGDKPISVQFAKIVEAKVASTGKGFRGQQDTTFKPATLENGVEILVPQFIETGDLIKIEVETGKYVERVKLDKAEKADKKPAKT